jgi:hypothetical protein
MASVCRQSNIKRNDGLLQSVHLHLKYYFHISKLPELNNLLLLH